MAFQTEIREFITKLFSIETEEGGDVSFARGLLASHGQFRDVVQKAAPELLPELSLLIKSARGVLLDELERELPKIRETFAHYVPGTQVLFDRNDHGEELLVLRDGRKLRSCSVDTFSLEDVPWMVSDLARTELRDDVSCFMGLCASR